MSEDPPFQTPVRVYWEDTDAGGIVYHSNYINFMERARTEWLRHIGLGQHELREQFGGMFVVSEVSVRYILPARLDDLLLVTAELHNLGRASITLRQVIYRNQAHADEAPQLLCEGTVRIGWVNSQSLRPGRIPEPVLKRMS